jgi:hypothetical protein
LRNIAECQETLGMFSSARRTWRDLRRALETVSEPKYAGWTEDAERADARLATRVSRLTLDVHRKGSTPANPIDGWEVTVNGEIVSHALVGTAIERDPGRYVVRVVDHGKNLEERVVELVEGRAERLTLDGTPAEPTQVPALAPSQAPAHTLGSRAAAQPASLLGSGGAAAPSAANGAGHREQVLSWVAIGAGSAAAVADGISLAIYLSARGSLADQCPTHQDCNPALQPTVDSGHTAATLVNVFSVLAVAGIGGGLVLLATSNKPAHEGIAVSPTGASVFGRF